MESQHYDQVRKHFVVFALLHLLAQFCRHVSSEETHFDITLPGYQPERDEVHVCVNVRVPVSGYITAISPLTTTERIHHLGLHACSDVQHALNEPWDCDIYYSCSGQKLLFSWDHVGAFELPNNTGMPIGVDSGLGYALLRVHYGRKFKGNIVDYSGVRLRVSSQRPAYIAGAYSLVADWGNTVPPNTKGVSFNQSCQYTLRTPLYAFAYRIHTHVLGRKVSAYKYSTDGKWTRLGVGDPRQSQRFVTHVNPILILPGDIITSQCLYDSTGVNHATHTGIHDHNEMCVFFLHYYIKAEDEDVTGQFVQCTKRQFNIFDKYPLEAPQSSSTPSEIHEEPAMAAAHDKVTFTIAESSVQLPAEIGRILDFVFDRYENLVLLRTGLRIMDQRTLPRSDLDDRTVGSDAGIPGSILVNLSPDGAMLLHGQWGKDMFFEPSGIFIDENDHLWVVDTKLQQIFKFNTTASLMSPLLRIGHVFRSGSDQQHFCDPSAVAASSGIAFVADGCGVKSRISKFSSTDGKPLGSWTFNRSANSPEVVSRSSISLDTNGQRIFVSNTHSSQVRIFSYDGNFLGQMKLFDANGSISDVSYCSGKNILFLIGRENVANPSVYRIFAFDASTYAAMYSWMSEEKDLNQSRTILASDDCSKVLVGELGSTKLRQFHIYTNMTRRANGDYMQAMEIGDEDDNPNGQDWMDITITFAIAVVPVICVVALFYAVLRRWRARRVGGTSQGMPNGTRSKYSLHGYRDYKGFKRLASNSEMSDAPLLSLDSSDQEEM